MPKRSFLFLAAFATLLALSGCSSFGPGTSPPQRALDALHDDIGGLLIAFDLPRGIGLMPGASSLTYAIPSARPIKAVLIAADADEIASQLPPPGNGRAYYFLALAPADRTSIRTLEAGARSANLAPTSITFTVTPGLCESAIVDPKSVTISILAATPGGQHLVPLVDHHSLAEFIGASAGLPACP